VARANRSLGRILGRDVTGLTGLPFAGLVSDPPELALDLVPADGEGRPPLVVRSPGQGRMLRLTAAPFTDPGGGSAVVVLVEDVTDQRALEGQLIQSEKMAAVGQLVSGVAHELNNPLTSIAGLSELLVEQARVPTEVRDHLRVIHAQADRAGRIVQNLLTFARKGAAERTLTDLNDVATRTALLVGYELRLRAITLEERLAAAPVLVHGDRYELQQVALNLLTNAIQAVAAAGRPDPGRVVIETGHEDGRAILRVTDNGPGVRPEDAGLLFTPFFTTKSPGEGTGLGLSISYGIVEAHGGKLEYAPAAGGGAAFTIALPVAEAPTTAPRRILLVDDDPKDERLVAALFARDGHVVEAVRTAEEGLARLAGGGIDLVVADARLATAGGEPFVQAAIRAEPAVGPRLLAAVPRSNPVAAERLRTAGLQVIAYPFDLKALRGAAEAVLGQ
jgi:two-component system NtrC family sensor kinase